MKCPGCDGELGVSEDGLWITHPIPLCGWEPKSKWGPDCIPECEGDCWVCEDERAEYWEAAT